MRYHGVSSAMIPVPSPDVSSLALKKKDKTKQSLPDYKMEDDLFLIREDALCSLSYCLLIPAEMKKGSRAVWRGKQKC